MSSEEKVAVLDEVLTFLCDLHEDPLETAEDTVAVIATEVSKMRDRYAVETE